VNRKRSDSTSSCSRSDEELHLQQQQQQQQHQVATTRQQPQQQQLDNADDLTCPSDFEGNAVIRPNLLQVPDSLTRLQLQPENGEAISVASIMHEPLPPPSRTASARREERPITLAIFSSSLADAYTTPTKKSSQSAAGGGGGIVSKIFQPTIAVFRHQDGEQQNMNSKGEVSPKTEATTPEQDLRGMMPDDEDMLDVRWSEISSEFGSFGGGDDGDTKTDGEDDFAMDQAWNPDDASVNSSEYNAGRDVFSPMAGATNDEVRLLKSTEGLKYDLHKINKKASSVGGSTAGSLDISPQRAGQVTQTLLV